MNSREFLTSIEASRQLMINMRIIFWRRFKWHHVGNDGGDGDEQWRREKKKKMSGINGLVMANILSPSVDSFKPFIIYSSPNQEEWRITHQQHHHHHNKYWTVLTIEYLKEEGVNGKVKHSSWWQSNELRHISSHFSSSSHIHSYLSPFVMNIFTFHSLLNGKGGEMGEIWSSSEWIIFFASHQPFNDNSKNIFFLPFVVFTLDTQMKGKILLSSSFPLLDYMIRRYEHVMMLEVIKRHINAYLKVEREGTNKKWKLCQGSIPSPSSSFSQSWTELTGNFELLLYLMNLLKGRRKKVKVGLEMWGRGTWHCFWLSHWLFAPTFCVSLFNCWSTFNFHSWIYTFLVWILSLSLIVLKECDTQLQSD